ncbi:RTA protein [Pyrenophora tritici-repentis]|nr:RTA protein [Pyrenophora tritici-repentis]
MGIIRVEILGEVIGYIGRVMLNLNPSSMNSSLQPHTFTIVLLTAGIYLSLGRVIVAIGAEISRLTHKMYTYIFVGCDILALILQAIGGDVATTPKDHRGSRSGVNIMIAGMISRVITMALFLALWADFALRTRHAKMSGSFSDSIPSSTLIFIRCIYRVAELWDGFNGKLANREATFMVFEGPMIFFAVSALTVFHPGRISGDLWVPAGMAY